MGSPHRRCHESLQKFPDAHINDCVTNAPHAPAHQTDPQQSWHQKINIGPTEFIKFSFLRGKSVHPSIGGLQNAVHDVLSRPCTGPFGIKQIVKLFPTINVRAGGNRQH